MVTVCRACVERRPVVEARREVVTEVRREPRRSWLRRVLVVAAGVGIAATAHAWIGRVPSLERAAAASVLVPPAPRAVVVPLFLPALAVAKPAAAAAPAPARAVVPPARLPAGATVYPLAGSDRSFPDNSDANFGSERTGDRPVECGAGHCGIDLRAEEGTAVLAARDGVVVGVHRDPAGRGGRWIQIDHGEASTLYFHLDTIRPDLAEGSRVVAGETLGTLGRSGVKTSPTHLHFAVLVDGTYVDPLRLLRRARVIPPRAPEARLAAAPGTESTRP